MEDKLMANVERLENLFRQFYATFERLRPIETDKDKMDHISVLEKARIFLVYPDHPFCQDKNFKQHAGERLRQYYRFSSSRNE